MGNYSVYISRNFQLLKFQKSEFEFKKIKQNETIILSYFGLFWRKDAFDVSSIMIGR